jgi:hypothetical protein
VSLRDSTKYIRNRNLWKKSSATHLRQKPRVLELRDGNTQERYALDIAKVHRFRDPYKIELGTPGDFYIDLVVGEYDEGLINVEDVSGGTFPFSFTFSGIPYVTLEIESMDFGNTAIAGAAITDSLGAYVAPTDFSGSIRYRAIYSMSYPAIVSSSYSASFVAVGGAYTMTDGSETFSETFPTGLLAPVTEVRATPIFTGDIFVDPYDGMVAVTDLGAQNNVDNGTINGSVSAPLSSMNDIHYLVVLG